MEGEGTGVGRAARLRITLIRCLFPAHLAFFFCRYSADPVLPGRAAGRSALFITNPPGQSWALSVFFYFFTNKKRFFAFLSS